MPNQPRKKHSAGVLPSIKPLKAEKGSKLSAIRQDRKERGAQTRDTVFDQPLKNPDTGELCPAPIEFIEECLLWGDRRGAVIRKCQDKYGRACPSVPTIDRMLREIKDEWLKEIEKTRTQRVARAQRRLDRIVIKAYRSKDLRTAKDAIMDMSKLVGDLAPEKVLMMETKDPDFLIAESDRLKLLAQRKDDE